MEKYLITYTWERIDQMGIELKIVDSVDDWVESAKEYLPEEKYTILSVVPLSEEIVRKIYYS